MLALSAIVNAEPEEEIARCARIASVGDRILCLENALRETSGEIVAKPVIESVDVAEEAAVAVDPAAVPEEAAVPPASPPVEAFADTVAVSAANSATESAEPVVEENEIGSEQVRVRTATQEERKADLESATGLRVAEYNIVPYERLVVTLENGQVWRQIKGDVQRIRVNLKRNQTVDINESGLGGYQLRLNEIRRTIRVERIK